MQNPKGCSSPGAPLKLPPMIVRLGKYGTVASPEKFTILEIRLFRSRVSISGCALSSSGIREARNHCCISGRPGRTSAKSARAFSYSQFIFIFGRRAKTPRCRPTRRSYCFSAPAFTRSPASPPRLYKILM